MQSARVPLPLVSFVFWASGFASLLYQVIWQRKLFTIYGTNIEAITVVVTAFMLGLGVGSLIGGALSRDPKRNVLQIFGLVEVGIGLYGAISIPLIDWVGHSTIQVSLVGAGVLAFALVLIPTLLMGATLPLLVSHLVRATSDVGRSVGLLYFVNTLGAAAGAYAAVALFLRHLGLSGSVYVAVAVNLFIGAAMLYSSRRTVAPAAPREAAP
jgi:spermidine synthase